MRVGYSSVLTRIQHVPATGRVFVCLGSIPVTGKKLFVIRSHNDKAASGIPAYVIPMYVSVRKRHTCDRIYKNTHMHSPHVYADGFP